MATSSSVIATQKRKISTLEDELRTNEAQGNSIAESMKYERAKLDGMLELEASSPALQPSFLQSVSTLTATLNGSHAMPGKRRRPISAQWQPIFARIAEKNDATFDEIAGVASARSIDRKLVRSQIAYYAKKGYISKDGVTGKYSVTDIGRDVSGLETAGIVSTQKTRGRRSQSLKPANSTLPATTARRRVHDMSGSYRHPPV